MVSVATIQLCPCSRKQPWAICKRMSVAMSQKKLYLQQQEVGQSFADPWARTRNTAFGNRKPGLEF